MFKTQFSPVSEDFSYGAAQDAAALKLSLSIFADRAHVRDQLQEDAESAGLRIVQVTGLGALRDEDARPLGDVVLIDCPHVDGAVLAALADIDMRAARAGAALVISTNVDALDDVFGCLDQSNPQILVSPSRAERLIALGQVLVRLPGGRVRELSEEDRLVLLRLTEQVNQIAERMEGIGGPNHDRHRSLGATASNGLATGSIDHPSPLSGLPLTDVDDGASHLIREAAAVLPDPKLVRRIIRQRQLRARFFDGDLFADPAWDMLLDLTAARAERSRVSVTSLCIASGVPPTTALRWIGQMTEAGLLQRNEDKTDKRRAFMTLTDKAAGAMASYFAQLADSAARVI